MPNSYWQTNLLNGVYNEFYDDLYVGDTISQMINAIQAVITSYSEVQDGASQRLIYPSPWPVLSGIQTLTFYIQNDQLYAIDSTQQISITVDLNDDQVTATTFVYFGPVTNTGTYDNALIPVELEIKKALEVYYQNGAAIFPLTYSFDPVEGIATSFLAEASDWKLDLTTGVVDRYPEIANPFGPVTYYPFPVLSAQETYILTLFDRIVNYTVLNPSATVSDVQTYANSILGSLTHTIATQAYGIIERISIQVSESRDFLLIGRFDVDWSFQRFFNPTSSTNDFLTDYNISVDLPYLPLTGVLFPDLWYSLEQCSFDNGCETEEFDTFQMPIKTGDTYQFNVIPSQANLFGLTTAKVGLFDSNLNFVQEIGTATISYEFTSLGMYGYSGPSRVTFDYWIDADYDSDLAIDFQMTDCDGNLIGDVLASIPINGLILGTFAEFKSVVEALDWPSYLSVIVTQNSDGFVVMKFTITNSPICFCAIAAYQYTELYGYVYYIKPNEYEQLINPTQFQASVTIPFAADGCYSFGLYNYDGTIAEIYSFSNPLSLDNSECFSTIWQFGTSENSIVEGFEYYNGWIQQVRLPINGGGDKPKIEESIYRNSDGTYQRPSNYSDNTLDLHSDYVDIETRNAVFAATRHPILIFNNQNIFVSGDLDVATVQDYSKQTSFRRLAQVKFSALIQGFQPENNVCIGC